MWDKAAGTIINHPPGFQSVIRKAKSAEGFVKTLNRNAISMNIVIERLRICAALQTHRAHVVPFQSFAHMIIHLSAGVMDKLIQMNAPPIPKALAPHIQEPVDEV